MKLINLIKEKYLKSEFIKNILTLITGTAIAQSIPLMISPILTRIYSPEDFGAWAIFISISGMISIISSLRYEMAIMLPKDEADADNIVLISLVLSASISLIAFILIIIFNKFTAEIFNFEGSRYLLYLTGITIFITSIYQILNLYSVRHKCFKRNASSRVIQTSTMSGVNVGLGAFHIGAGGLIIGSISGQLAGTAVLLQKVLRGFDDFKKNISKKRIKKNLHRYRNFAKINTPHAFIDSFQESGLFLIITHFFASTVLGFYSFAFRILKLPLGLLGTALYQVFYEKASKEINENRSIKPLLIKMYKNLAIGGFPVFLILYISSPDIFAIIFGDNWRLSGEIARILSPWLYLNFIASPLSCIPVIMNRQMGAMIFTICDISLKISAIMIGVYFDSYKISFIFISFFCSILILATLIWYYRIAGSTKENSYTQNSDIQ